MFANWHSSWTICLLTLSFDLTLPAIHVFCRLNVLILQKLPFLWYPVLILHPCALTYSGWFSLKNVEGKIMSSFYKEWVWCQVQDALSAFSLAYTWAEASSHCSSFCPHLIELPFIVSSNITLMSAVALFNHTSFYFSSFNWCVNCRTGSKKRGG